MTRKPYFCLFVGVLWLINSGEVRGQETRGPSLAAASQNHQQLDSTGKTNAGRFERTYSLAINPAGKEMFLGTNVGLFRRAIGGRAWKKVPVPAKRPNLDVMAIVLDPKQANSIFIATREDGMFASADGGTGWSRINNGLGGLDAEGLAIDPNDGKLHAAIRAKQPGIYRTTDGDNKWDRVNGGPGKEINFLSSVNISTGMGGIFLYAGTAEGLYRSPDCF